MKNKFVNIIKKKWLRSVGLTILLFVIIICAYIAIDYGASILSIADLDFTAEKIYSISQETKDKLENLEDDVTISVYNMGEYVKDFAHKYEGVNSHIKSKELENLTGMQEIKSEYNISDDSSFVLVEAGSKRKMLSQSDLYTYDYSTAEEIDTTEEAITNAVLDVTTIKKPKVYFLKGHNLYTDSYFQYLTSNLENESNEVETVDILVKGSIPDDCNVLVITALADDITNKEKDQIIKYIRNGGEILFLVDPTFGEVKTPNLNKVLEEYAVSISEGFVLEGDSSKMMAGAPNFVISAIDSHSAIVRNTNMTMNVLLMNPGKINIIDDKVEEKNVTIEPLATLSESAFYRTEYDSNSLTKISSDQDAAGETLAAMCTKQNGDDGSKVSKMIVFGNTAFATNAQIQLDTQYYMYAIDGYNNKDVILNSISYLTDREDNITIRKNASTDVAYDLNAMQRNIILGIIFAIPVFLIIIGIVVWQLRRRKK